MPPVRQRWPRVGGVQEGHGPDVRNRARCSLSQPRLRPAATTLCSFTRVPGGEPPSGDHGSSDSHRELRRWRLGFLSRCFPQLPTQGAPQPGVPPCAGGPGVQSSPSTASATVTQPPFPGGWSPFWIPAEAMTTEDPARAWASEAGDEHSSLPTQPQPAGGGGLHPPPRAILGSQSWREQLPMFRRSSSTQQLFAGCGASFPVPGATARGRQPIQRIVCCPCVVRAALLHPFGRESAPSALLKCERRIADPPRNRALQG